MKKKFLLLGIGLSALLTAGTVIPTLAGLSKNNSAIETRAEEGTFVLAEGEAPFKATYLVNETFEVPEGTIAYDSKQLSIESHYLIFPDGNALFGNTFTLNQIGTYKLVYKGLDGTKVVKAEVEFIVYSTAYSLTSDSSTFEYVDAVKTFQDATPGIEVKLKEGDSFYYNQPVNLNDLGDDPFINFAPHCRSLNADHLAQDAMFFVVTITDYFDPTNQVVISLGQNLSNQTYGTYHYYGLAKGPNQGYTGLEKNDNYALVVDNVNYRLHNSGTQFGCYLPDNIGRNTINDVPEEYTFINPEKQKKHIIHNADDHGFQLYYESETKRVYVELVGKQIITDLDEPAIYGNNVFKGFTTGDVLISLSANGYNEQVATIDVLDLAGRNGTSLNDELIYDTTKPTITIENDIDNFVISKNEPFKIPSAKASDLNLAGDVQVEVYYQYQTLSESFTPISNGYFTPLKAGNYSIVYTAEDTYGNVQQLVRNCYAVTTLHDKANDLTTTQISNVKAGQYVDLPAYTLETLNDGKFVNIKAIYEDGSEYYLNKENKLFFPRVGNYTIVFEYGDEVIKNSYSYEVEAQSNEDYHYIDNLIIPNYLIKDSFFSLEDYEVVLVNTKEFKTVMPEVYANFGSDFEKITDPNKIKVNTNKDKVSFKFMYNSKLIKQVNDVPVVNVGFGSSIDMSKYFVGNVQTTATASSATMTLNDVSGNTTVDFINSLLLQVFEIKITLDNANCRKMVMHLTDIYDSRNVMNIEYIPSELGYDVNLNGQSYNRIGKKQLNLSYSPKSNSFNLNGEKEILYPSNLTNGRFNLSFEFVGLSGTQVFSVQQINNQSFTDLDLDIVQPRIYSEDATGTVKLNSTVEVNECLAVDVLTPFVKTNLIPTASLVVGDNTSFIKNIDGVLLDGSQSVGTDIKFKCDTYGIVYVTFKYTDQSNKSVSRTDAIYVRDNTAPTLKINNGVDEKTIKLVKTGSTVKVEGYVASDDVSSGAYLKTGIYVMSPSLVVTHITDNKFVANESGDWQVCYFAKDDNGNVTVRYYIVRAY